MLRPLDRRRAAPAPRARSGLALAAAAFLGAGALTQGCAAPQAPPPSTASATAAPESRLAPLPLPPDPDRPLQGRLLVLRKPAPGRLPLGYQKKFLAQHRTELRGAKKGWTLHLFAHVHRGAGRLDRARVEVRRPDASFEDPPLYYQKLDLLQHEVRMARTIRFRRSDPTFKAGRTYKLSIAIPGEAQPLAETVLTLR